ncbi:MAG TPA: AMP-binding protein, partial [Pirellulales bacterium]
MNQNRSILECRSLVELLEQRATLTPNAIAYVRLEDGRTESDSLTYAQMDRRARAIAVRLRLRYALGSRCMLLFTHSFDAMVAFMGCLYAGMVPVPIPAPVGSRVKRALPRVEAVMRDSQAIAILSTFSTASSLSSEHGLQQLGGMDIFHLEDVPDHLADQWSIPPTDPRGVAYLQYTSGSTSSPKGVMVSHHNILHHSECLRKAWGYDESSVSATWMPYYHDYGLVDGLIQPLYSGIPCYVMSSLAFIKRPIRWLEIISRYGVTHSQGPNFAYEYCIRRIATQDLDNVNLISWRTASNGAETIRAETAERFIAKFAPFGFRPEAFFPTYGLAEATLVVSTKRRETLWNCVTVDAHAMERCRVVLTSCASRAARRVVSCGIAAPHVTIAIVNLDLRQRCSANEIGEVWVSGPSVTQGYWNRPEESSKLFEARIVGDPRPYLRTGDLGFVLNDEVFITGRLKDLVIVAGANHHPEDIEWTVQSAHAAIRADAVAAFSVDRGGEERLVVAAEFEKVGSDLTEVAESVRAALAEVHDLQLDTFVFLRHGEIPKTSSFKVQRYACRQAFLDGQWRVVGIWNAPSGQGVSLNEFDDMGVSKQRAPLSSPEAATAKSGSPVTDPAESAPDRKMPPGYAEITDWLCARMSRLTGEAARRLDWNAPFSSYGATSRELVSLIGELEQFLGTSLSSTLPWNYPTIRSLASFLAGGTTRRVPDADTSESHVDRRVTESREGIAVVGIGCRFPGGGRGPGGYWQMLRGGRDAVGDAPEWRGLGAGL